MATLRAEWPNEARQHERIKNIESIRTQCQLLATALTESIRELNPAYGKENISGTLRVAWPNEARRYEKIKAEDIYATSLAQWAVADFKSVGIHRHSGEEIKIYT